MRRLMTEAAWRIAYMLASLICTSLSRPKALHISGVHCIGCRVFFWLAVYFPLLLYLSPSLWGLADLVAFSGGGEWTLLCADRGPVDSDHVFSEAIVDDSDVDDRRRRRHCLRLLGPAAARLPSTSSTVKPVSKRQQRPTRKTNDRCRHWIEVLLLKQSAQLKWTCIKQHTKTAVKRFSCFSQSQSVSAVCAPSHHRQQIPTVIGQNSYKRCMVVLVFGFCWSKTVLCQF